MAELNMAYLSSLKNRAKLMMSSLTVSSSRVLRAPGTPPYHLVPKHLRATWPSPEQSHLFAEACSPNATDNERHIKYSYVSCISKFLLLSLRHDDFQLIRITCQAACHGKTENGIFVEFKKTDVPPAHHHTLRCRSTLGPRGPGLRNPTSFLRPALPMAPTTEHKLNFCMVLYLEILAPGAAL